MQTGNNVHQRSPNIRTEETSNRRQPSVRRSFTPCWIPEKLRNGYILPLVDTPHKSVFDTFQNPTVQSVSLVHVRALHACILHADTYVRPDKTRSFLTSLANWGHLRPTVVISLSLFSLLPTAAMCPYIYTWDVEPTGASGRTPWLSPSSPSPARFLELLRT